SRRRPLHPRRGRTGARRKHRRQAPLTRARRAHARPLRGGRGRRRLAHDPPPRRRVSTVARAAVVVAANPRPAVHLAALAIVLLVGLATYGVVRWRRRRANPEAEGEPEAHDHSSAHSRSKTLRP